MQVMAGGRVAAVAAGVSRRVITTTTTNHHHRHHDHHDHQASRGHKCWGGRPFLFFSIHIIF
ncbi:hypothetical protein I7I50_08689 [Histoplasma capsulatum G186AR]|uniref:Uncharacterized protein n=1 Tax=Ajellomyces capsulatus TaxID=5037 RepID=A0A8H7YT72_AJECA|nr:hypothetical protein I7I52_06203 [Histoplasma capsulatum]QSS73790.1 hypothetical protein I7I50_08689 [Histoplasma capsulatum G186AR]